MISAQIEQYLALESAPDYSRFVHEPEHSLLENKLQSLISMHETYNVVDLGCGDAKKGIYVTNLVQEITGRSGSYVPLDISTQMLRIAEQNLKASGIDYLLGSFNRSDIFHLGNLFENLRASNSNPSLILLLGSTFGNFQDPRRLLHGIRANMCSDDVLVLGTGVTNCITDVEGLERAYGGEHNRRFLSPLVESLGYDENEYSFFVKYNEATKSVDHFFELHADKEISIGSATIDLRSSDLIKTAVSIKHSIQDLADALSVFDARIYTANNSSYALAGCRLRRQENEQVS